MKKSAFLAAIAAVLVGISFSIVRSGEDDVQGRDINPNSVAIVGNTFSVGTSTLVVISGGVGISTNSPGQFIGGAWDSRGNKPQLEIAGVNPRVAINGSGDAQLVMADAGNSPNERIATIGLSGTLFTLQSKNDAGAVSKNYISMNQNTGNVGINLADGASPASALEVKGAFQWGNTAAVSTGAASGSLAVAGPVTASSAAAAGPAYSFIGDADSGLFSPAANIVGLATGGSERLRVTSVGAIGVGTTNPGVVDSVDSSGNVPHLHVAGANPRLVLEGSGDAALSLTDLGSTAGSRTFNINNNATLVNIQAMDASMAAKSNMLEFDLVNGGVKHWSRTIAQLQSIPPSSAGQTFYCSDCTLAGGRNVVSTGTSAGNFADADGSDWD